MCWSCLVVGGGGWTFDLITSTHRISASSFFAHTRNHLCLLIYPLPWRTTSTSANNHSIPTRLLHSTATGSANYDWLAGAYQNRHETPVLKNPIKIIYIDDDLLVLDKPCSLPVSTPTLCFVPVCPWLPASPPDPRYVLPSTPMPSIPQG